MPTVSMQALKSAVAKGPLDPVYLFHGADDFLKESWVRRVVETAVDPGMRDFNLELLRAAECDLARLSGALDALPMLAERRVVVLRDPGALKKAERARLAAYLERPASETVLLLVVPAGGKTDTALLNAASSLEFKALEGEDLLKWIAHQAKTECQTTIAPDAAALLASYGGNDLALLTGELRKLVAYTNGETIDTAAIEAVTGVRQGHTMGDLLDCVATRDITGAVALVEEVIDLPKSGGVPVVMALTSQMLAIGWVLAARARGLHPSRVSGELFALLKGAGGAYTGRAWGEAVTCWTTHAPKWTAAEVDRAIDALLRADLALKDTKVSSEAQLVTSLILEMSPTTRTRRVA
jgi:DNA polymerase-3 subunit delta